MKWAYQKDIKTSVLSCNVESLGEPCPKTKFLGTCCIIVQAVDLRHNDIANGQSTRQMKNLFGNQLKTSAIESKSHCYTNNFIVEQDHFKKT
jgi:hypothetical protein